MNLGVIGTGRMAQAIVGGILKSSSLSPESIIGTDPDPMSRERFLDLDPQGKLRWEDSIGSLCSEASCILVSVKPQNINAVLEHLKEDHSHVPVISIAAGISLAQLKASLGDKRPIIRVMPNTPLLVGKGVVAWCANESVRESDEKWISLLFSSVSEVYQVQESEMDAVTALSGSGPAFFYRIIQFLEEAAIQEGLSPSIARAFAAETATGAAAMLQMTKLEPDELVSQVRSKGGTTEAGLNVLERGELKEILVQTIQAAASRSRELGK